MKKSLFTLLITIIGYNIALANIKFEENPDWSTILQKAKSENKLIFFNAFTTWCGYCKKMDNEVYTNKEVAAYYNDTFINVKYNMEAGEGLKLAMQYNVRSFPTSLYIDGNGKIVHKSLGFIEPEVFLENGKLAFNPELRSSGVRERALRMTTKDFLTFGVNAVQSGDREYEMIASEYLTAHDNVLADKNLLDIIMQTVDVLPNEKILTDLINNKEQVIKIGGYDPNELEIRLVGLSVSYAIAQSTDPNTGEQDLEKFNSILLKVIPEKAYFTSNYYKIEYHLRKDAADKAYEIYEKFLDSAVDKSSFNELSNMVIAFGASFPGEEQLKKSFGAIDNYPVKEVKNTDSFQKNLIRVLVYLKLHDEENFKLYATKILEDPNAPQELKNQIENTLEQIESGVELEEG